jgi:hypothetical protein
MGMGRRLSAGVLIAVLGAAIACSAPRRDEPSLRLHAPEPTGTDLVPPQRLSGEMPDLAGLFGPAVKTVTCAVAATVTSDGDLTELEWEKAESVDPRFRMAVERAMASWKFRPATFLGRPASLPSRFELDRCPLSPGAEP